MSQLNVNTSPRGELQTNVIVSNLLAEQATYKVSKDDIEQSSTVDILNYIRFHSLKHVPAKDMRKLFSVLLYVNFHDAKEVETHVNILNSKNISMYMNLKPLDIDTEKIAASTSKVIEQLPVGAIKIKEVKAYVKDMEQILDLYFEHTEEKSARNVLEFLCSIPIESDKQWTYFLETYQNLPKEEQGKDRSYRC